MLDYRNKTVDIHSFAMIPRADIPRSSFRRQWSHKTTFEGNKLIPIYVDEVLPGDTFSLQMTAFSRFSTFLEPIMDNVFIDSFFFFVPCRLIWRHWKNFMGEQYGPSDSISFVVPQIILTQGWGEGTLGDYFGLPTVDMMSSGTFSHNALPFRAYNLIWQEWFRDENLQQSPAFGSTGVSMESGFDICMDDGPDLATNYVVRNRNKAHDYFTGCLPWPEKGGAAVSVPLAGLAHVVTGNQPLVAQVGTGLYWTNTDSTLPTNGRSAVVSTSFGTVESSSGVTGGSLGMYPNNLYADLSTATATTINALRQSFQIQKLLERDARGGTRYTESIFSHFGVRSPDARLQRPEYLGGGSTRLAVGAVPQTSATGLTGGTTAKGSLSAYGTALNSSNGFTQSFTEHGYIIGLVNCRADITYQQGVRKLWSRNTRYDFYFPVFATLGEQAVLNQEIYAVGNVGQDQSVFGYQERWAEYRYFPSMITSLYRSTAAAPLDFWHLSEKFTSLPTLSDAFIRQNSPFNRVLAEDDGIDNVLMDAFFDCRTTRLMPMYSVPGLIDHF